jgi:quercetin dioxygenase-like cupin family protein
MIMTVQAIKDQLENADHPIAKSFHTGDHFKVLLFGFKKGMKLEDHTAHHPTKLLVLEGDVIYHQEQKDVRLK